MSAGSGHGGGPAILPDSDATWALEAVHSVGSGREVWAAPRIHSELALLRCQLCLLCAAFLSGELFRATLMMCLSLFHSCQPIQLSQDFSDFNIESGFSHFHCYFLLFWKIGSGKKGRKKSGRVKFSIQLFQTEYGILEKNCFSTCLKHHFAGGRSIQMSASANTDDSSEKTKRNKKQQKENSSALFFEI